MCFYHSGIQGLSEVASSKVAVLIKLISNFAQSRAPWFHSWASPMVSRLRTINVHSTVVVGVMFSAQGRGNSSAISRSNSRKKIATRKN